MKMFVNASTESSSLYRNYRLFENLSLFSTNTMRIERRRRRRKRRRIDV
jgi:hypothetical protein